MIGDIKIPTDYGITLGGSVDVGLDDVKINNIAKITVDAGLGDIHVKEFPSSALKTDSDIHLKEFPSTPLKTDSKLAMGLDDIRIKELPKIQLEAQFSLKPTRVHLPLNYKLSVGIMGYELVGFALCGEGMVITEDYHKHVTEGCE